MSSSVGKITYINGEYSIIASDGSVRVAQLGDKVYDGETVKGNGGSEIEVTYNNDNVVLAGSDANIHIDASVCSAERFELADVMAPTVSVQESIASALSDDVEFDKFGDTASGDEKFASIDDSDYGQICDEPETETLNLNQFGAAAAGEPMLDLNQFGDAAAGAVASYGGGGGGSIGARYVNRDTGTGNAHAESSSVSGYNLGSKSLASSGATPSSPAATDSTTQEDQANNHASRVYELTEFLVDILNIQLEDLGQPQEIAIHTSCAARREMGVADKIDALVAQLKNITVLEQAYKEECCGFGGTFAVKEAEISASMVADKTANIKKTGVTQLVSQDAGCLMNISGSFNFQGDDVKCDHIANFLWDRTHAK